MLTKFYNKMEFPIKMRKIWEPGSPAIELKSGAIIEGPYETLIQYKFLSPLPFEFHKVDSTTQNQNFEFKDDKSSVDAPLAPQVEESSQDTNESDIVEPNLSSESESASEPNEYGLSFNPKSVNWLHIKVVELEEACKKLGINISHLDAMKKKEKKWALVKLIKVAVGLTSN